MTTIKLSNSVTVEHDPSRLSIPQGDVTLIPILAVPGGCASAAPENGTHILAHSETGHHHVVMERPDIKQFFGPDQFTDFLEVFDSPAELIHLRATHTHETQTITPGAWLVKRQAAYTPQGWERARD
jgi:hypothetical protein